MTSIIPILKRGKRTSRFVILLRMYLIGTVFMVLPMWVFCNTWWEAFKIWVGVFFYLFLPSQLAICIICNVVAFLIYHSEPGYWERKATGHDEFFDNEWMPPFFNPDSWGLKLSGMKEPNYGFEIPDDWLLFCFTCGARNPLGATRCHYCQIEFGQRR